MPNYLLECEIVGGSIVNPVGVHTNSLVVVIPTNSVCKSNLIGGLESMGIALEECPSNRFSVALNASLKSIPLKDTGEAEFVIAHPSIATQLFPCKNQRVVLELNDKKCPEVIGFKVQF